MEIMTTWNITHQNVVLWSISCKHTMTKWNPFFSDLILISKPVVGGFAALAPWCLAMANASWRCQDMSCSVQLVYIFSLSFWTSSSFCEYTLVSWYIHQLLTYFNSIVLISQQTKLTFSMGSEYLSIHFTLQQEIHAHRDSIHSVYSYGWQSTWQQNITV